MSSSKVSTLTPISFNSLATTAPVSRLSWPKKYIDCNIFLGLSIFFTDFNKPLYTSWKLTGTINGSPFVNSLLPKKSVDSFVVVAK